jgi:ribonuclease HI
MDKASMKSLIPCRELASVLGTLNFLRTQFPAASLYMNRLNSMKCAGVRKNGWNGMLTMTPQAQGELKWWMKAVAHNSPRNWQPKPTDLTITTDASPSGWGAMCQERGKETTYLWGSWPKTAQTWSSNKRELTAILRVLKELTHSAQFGASVKVCSDNTAAVFAIRGWKSTTNRIPALRRLWNLLQSRGWSLTAQYLPGALNDAADKLSRMSDSGEYRLSMTTVRTLQAKWNIPLTLDVFASKETALLTRYCTKDASDAEAVATDGLSYDWRGEVVLLHPPPVLILKTVQKAMREAALGILIVPSWKGQNWYPLLQGLDTQMMDLGPYQTAVQRTAEMTSRGWLLPPGEVHAYILGMRMTAGKSYLMS